ncbi:MAG: hypothetical protein E6767_05225 [Dysgonomonas sp.]|nr:hypothetical protein [Dysgonomonas sp.]
MKKLILFIIISPIIFLSCGHNDDSWPPYIYDINLIFTDKDGNDILKDIPEGKLWNTKLEILSTDGKNTPNISEPEIEVWSKDEFHEEIRFLNIMASSFKKSYRPNEISFNLICPEIFSDNKEHLVITKWDFPDNSDSNIWISVSVDGKEYEPKSPNNQVYNKFATIILD